MILNCEAFFIFIVREANYINIHIFHFGGRMGTKTQVYKNIRYINEQRKAYRYRKIISGNITYAKVN